jgi:hypothetical protein
MKDGKSAGIGLSGKKSGTGTGSRLGTAHQPNTRFRCPTFIFRLANGNLSINPGPIQLLCASQYQSCPFPAAYYDSKVLEISFRKDEFPS